MTTSIRRSLLFTSLLLLVTPALRAQDTAAAGPVVPTPKRMTAQWGLGLTYGLSPRALGIDARLYIPINALRGLRSVSSIGFLGVSGYEAERQSVDFIALRTELTYNFIRFSGVNSGIYARAGLVCDMIHNGLSTEPDLGPGVGIGLSDIGLFVDVGHAFTTNSRTHLTFGFMKTL